MILKVRTYEGSAQDHYHVTLIFGGWPSDKRLIKLCDPTAKHGYIGSKSETCCKVFIYKE